MVLPLKLWTRIDDIFYPLSCGHIWKCIISNINLSSEFDTNSIAIGLSEELSRGQLLKSSKYNVWGTWPAGHIEEEDN